MNEITQRVQRYWTARARDFASIRKNELKDSISERWLNEFNKYFSNEKPLNILDVGTGSGYFAILLSKTGHKVTGIDITKSMLFEARETAADCGVAPEFILMDAQNLDYPDNTFDVIVSRNLTWTLPDPPKAYSEWYRVLKPGGIILNFDADYAENVRNENQRYSQIDISDVYGHTGVTKEQAKENSEITLLMPAGNKKRPSWDIELMQNCGFESAGFDASAGARILKEHDLPDAPLFLVYGRK